MSRYFSYNAYTDKTEDIVWRDAKHPGSKVWDVWLGEHLAGKVWMGRRDGCTAVILNPNNVDLLGPRRMEGFATRWAATEYILKVGGYQGDRDRFDQPRTRMEYGTLEIEKQAADMRVERLEKEVESLRQIAMRQQATEFPLAFTEVEPLEEIELPTGIHLKLRRLSYGEIQGMVKNMRADDVAAIAEHVTTMALRPY